MSADQDLEIIAEQEKLLRFAAFNTDTAWQLGNLLRSMLLERKAGGTIEIEIAGQILFACTTPGASPGQANWVRRKRNTVRTFAKSSYAVGLTLDRDGDTLAVRQGLELKDYAIHGGGFPLHVTGMGVIGSIVVSGLPQRDDHELAVTAIAQLLGVAPPQLS
jgi:uncharacterized protein (UPF0303 family)